MGGLRRWAVIRWWHHVERVSIQKWRDGLTWMEGQAMQSPADDLALPIIERHEVAVVAVFME